MVAAKEKTLSYKTGSSIEPQRNNFAPPTTATAPSTAINRISSYDFRTRKFKKSPIGPTVKIHFIVLVENQQRPRKTQGDRPTTAFPLVLPNPQADAGSYTFKLIVIDTCPAGNDETVAESQELTLPWRAK